MMPRLFIGLVMAAVIVNGATLVPRIFGFIQDVKQSRQQRVGEAFKPLIPYLRQERWAGYLDCRTSSDPYTDTSIMAPYQQAQFILSPVLLDFKHPLRHAYLIVYCPDSAQRRGIQESLDAELIAESSERLVLLRRSLP